ncbi:MAG: methylated-DNA--[protein]-cysteine S-methyltransferase [Gammaproteobacteria bacterium]|nr:methylated-DNA--[protein]-cysteine S-methyltransferase [Gammaproteobacteria bacterium]
MPDYAAVIATPIPGVRLGLIFSGEKISEIDFVGASQSYALSRVGAVQDAMNQLQEYFLDPKRMFSLEIAVTGTPFQKRVWHQLQQIPAGETRTYGELAKRMHTSPRAVGAACRSNPLPIIIPCHRVVAANGIGGFMGKQSGRAMLIKQWLLRHEGVDVAAA